MDDKEYVAKFLTEIASPELVDVFLRAIDRAESGHTSTYLAHVLDALLDDPTVRARISESVETHARTVLAEQILGFADSGAGAIAFKLPVLLDPAKQMAVDWGAQRVSPLNFLATCLSTSILLDPASLRTQEALRSSGLTLDTLLPAQNSDSTRRQDFTFTSLGMGTDVTAMARAGFWSSCPLVGLEQEVRTLAKLLNSGMGSAVIVGEPGVGKSAFIQGFAYHIAFRDRRFIPASMDSWTVVMIEPADVLQGTSGRGELESRVKQMLMFFRKTPTVIPFFEEVHRLLDTDDPSTRSIATALKPPMATGQFRCVACTTDKEYARFISSDEALNSRFRKILLPEPDHATAMQIIKSSKPNLLRGKACEKGIDLTDDAIATSVRVTAAYQRAERLPRKAINLLSAVISERVYQLDMAIDAQRLITGPDVARLFTEISGIPVDAIDDQRPAYYRALADQLRRRVQGQDEAIASVTSWLSLQASGWVDQRRPRGRFLFLCPPGVGKTELALALADEIIRDRGSVIILNMSEYQGEGARNKFMGADPGYIGYGQTATIYSRVMLRPFSVVVLDEFEKTDPTLSNSLLTICDGWGVDSQGRSVDFSQCIFVLTSNAVELGTVESFSGATGPGDRTPEGDEKDEHVRQFLRSLGGIWNAGILDRIDRICAFNPLDNSTLLNILGTLINTRRGLASRPLPAEIDDLPVRQSILADACAADQAHSARRLERSLMRWLSARANDGRDEHSVGRAG